MAFEQGLDTGNTAFMFISMGLVQFMTPGLAFFYGGLVSKGNVLAMMMQSYVSMAVVTLLWFTFVFSLCFGDSWGFVGSPFTYLNFKDVAVHGPLTRNGENVSDGIPGVLYAGYQCMFAIITPPLMSGAFADRFRFKPYVLFISAWILVVYAPLCHWTWGGGWLAQLGIADWAGGIVVHISAGFSSLASLLFVGRRFQVEAPPAAPVGGDEPHNVPFVALGTAMLWFGWYGFNGGSSYLSNGAGILATINSQFAAAAAAVVWLVMDVLVSGKRPGMVSFCVGAVAGLATITPAAGYIQPGNAIFLGGLSAVWCWGSVQLAKKLERFGCEDALDVWGVHGMGGFLGTIMVGLLADGPECADVNIASIECANPGVVTRSLKQFILQFAAAFFCAAYSVLVTYSLLKAISSFMSIVPQPVEQMALDEAEHGEAAYVLEPLPADSAPDRISVSHEELEAKDSRFASNTKTANSPHIEAYDDASTTGSTDWGRENTVLSFSSSHYDDGEDRISTSRMDGIFPSRILAKMNPFSRRSESSTQHPYMPIA